MAIFNPDVPKIPEKEYMKDSQAISPYSGDSSAGTLLKGFGDTLKAAFTGADESFKAVISDKVYQATDPIKEQTIAGLEDATTNPKSKSLTSDAEGASLPPDLEDGVSGIEGLVEGYDSAKGRLVKMNLRKEIHTLAKDLRSQFPGYRDFIDQKFAQAMTQDPANKYMDSLISILNQQQNQGAKDKNYALRQANEGADKGYPGGAAAVAKVQSGQWSITDVANWKNLHAAVKYNLDLKKAQSEDAQIDIKERERLANTTLDGDMTTKAMDMFETFRLTTSKNPSSTSRTGKELQQLAIQAEAGEFTPTTQQTLEWRQQIQGIKSQVEYQMRQKSITKGADGLTLIERLGENGAEKFEKKLAGYLTVYDSVANKFTKDSLPLAAATAQKVQGHYADYEMKLLGDPQWAGYLGAMDIINRRAPTAAREWIINSLGNDLPAQFNQKLMQMQTSMRLSDNVPGAQKPSLLEGVRTLQAVPDSPYKPEDFKRFIDVVDTISDPKWDDKTKINVIWSAYGPRNSGFLDKFEKDTADQAGKASIYSQLTSKDKLAEVARLDKTNPGLMRMAQNWSKSEFMRVYGTELKDLNDIPANPNFKLSYRTEDNQFSFKYTPAAAKGRINATDKFHDEPWAAQYKQAVININTGLEGFTNVAEAGKFQATPYILKNLIDLGWQPAKGSAAEQLVNTMLTATTPPPPKASGSPSEPRTGVKKEEGTPGVPHFAQPDRTRTLGDWLSNPGGQEPQEPAGRKMPPGQNLGDIVGVGVTPIPRDVKDIAKWRKENGL